MIDPPAVDNNTLAIIGEITGEYQFDFTPAEKQIETVTFSLERHSDYNAVDNIDTALTTATTTITVATPEDNCNAPTNDNQSADDITITNSKISSYRDKKGTWVKSISFELTYGDNFTAVVYSTYGRGGRIEVAISTKSEKNCVGYIDYLKKTCYIRDGMVIDHYDTINEDVLQGFQYYGITAEQYTLMVTTALNKIKEIETTGVADVIKCDDITSKSTPAVNTVTTASVKVSSAHSQSAGKFEVGKIYYCDGKAFNCTDRDKSSVGYF